ncbi:hypothetical protein COZ61_00340 [Candidatus Berkelbacteria bacterium CG_4_8_14_3_um_filter_33_6]|uniref:Baseplate protein J-like domain-containing protein n=1 Tax=Candidatus Berkelbacteria bacterium CG_4_10_14_0_2_um_filter_35_9_33_12 TaxID=1974499 RepID=A0A2M7W5R3_9BACT|nr:MAG: hypothetical protein COX10_01205 [Candidatus Berkelbacteria bacterium CG23_combo_of_CG06-09_8_20_14_all_33_15]PIS08192.1 MAG: hypothetical protein COT76_02755 [Candidatus Berkelbacteria bacterium CG10_big_fil_rev_8_21_14_0_10_33_10]PIX31324.1 MAG: hypothetical protein COZ61_00340 [Candidatus Berkelbacteria bacterium CG_4_8_14_3_um_filter_33_6]PIZ28151.1 MAG: hypothetical protein COY43_01910 [Candidatus Berkelbacteria bacterium CG_4_10_14_0_8_um_filter_35_9_33_8]PJA21015.1 MAG: hypotheti
MSEKKEKEIIYLDVDEELPSIVAKIKNSTQTQIVLVVPKGALILQSLINLKLIKKNADKEKKKISFVTQDQVGKNLLIKTGYQIDNSVGVIKDKSSENREEFGAEEDVPLVTVHHFQSTNTEVADEEEIEKKVEEEKKIKEIAGSYQEFNQKKVEAIKLPRKKFNLNFKKLALIILFILLLFGIIIFGPSATVSISVIGEPFKQTEKIEIVEATSKDSLTANQVSGKILTFEAKAQEDFQTTGKKNVGEKAKATIMVYNSWSTEIQTVAKDSVFKKNDLEFILLSDISVPGATLSLTEGKISTVAGKTSATIEAKEAGDNYNVSSGRFIIESISGEKREKIYGETDKSMTGGSTQEIKIISQEDYNLAVEKLENLAKEEAKNKLVEQNKELQIFVDAISTETVDKKSSKNIGSEAEKFNLLVKVKATVIGVDANEYKNKFIELIKKQVPEDKSLNLRENDAIEIKIETQDYANKKLSTISNISTQLSPKLDLEKIKKEIVFKPESIAEDMIKSDQVEKVIIDLKPAYNPIKKLPIISSRIKVQIEYE